MTGKKVGVNFGVANAIGGVDVKFAGWDYSPMLPRVCSLFTCHTEIIKRNFSHYRKHGMYSIYYLTSKRIGTHSTELNALEKLLKHQHIVGNLATHCKTLNSGLSKKNFGFFIRLSIRQSYRAHSVCLCRAQMTKKLILLDTRLARPHACLGFVDKSLSEVPHLCGVDCQ